MIIIETSSVLEIAKEVGNSDGMNFMGNETKYSCVDYRQEMILLGLKRRLAQEDLSEKERRAIIEEIKKMESTMRMDE